MYDTKPDSIKTLKERRERTFGRMSALNDAVNSGRKLTPGERDEWDKLDRDLRQIDATIRLRKDAKRRANGESKADSRTEGRAGEALAAGQSFRGWYNRAVENDVSVTHGDKLSGYQTASLRSQGTDRDMNRYWAERMQLAKPTVETRALLEDTAGSAQAITPQQWVSDYVDVLLPETILGKVGCVAVPMAQETTNVPVFTSTVSPSWIAEAGSISLDANPAFSPLTLFATGGFKDTTLFSVEAAQDAYIRGDLDGMLAHAVAMKMAVVLDTSMLLGVTSNTGIPGLINESGFVTRKQTGDSGTTGLAPTTTTELGVIAETSVKKNIGADELAFVSNVGTHEAFERIAVSAYGKYWDNPSLAQPAIDGWVTSENSALAYTETDPASGAPAQTGGSYSSLYCGPWSRFAVLGVHLDLQTRILNERYIDSGQIGLFAFARYSIRFAHPETFSRSIGVITV